MNDSTATLAIWNAKQVEWIAVKIMNWHNVQARGHDESSRIWAAAVYRDQNHYWDFVAEIEWNPIRDWNDFRSVELKIMEDEKMIACYHGNLKSLFPRTDYAHMKATLPERCTALFLAFNSLNP